MRPGELHMATTDKLITTNQSQTVQLPKAFRFEGSEVFIHREGKTGILSPKPKSWDGFFSSAERPSADFMAERIYLKPDKSELFEYNFIRCILVD